MGILPKSSTCLTFIIVGLTGVFISQTLLAIVAPDLPSALAWLYTIIASLVMYVVARILIRGVRKEGKFQERYG